LLASLFELVTSFPPAKNTSFWRVWVVVSQVQEIAVYAQDHAVATAVVPNKILPAEVKVVNIAIEAILVGTGVHANAVADSSSPVKVVSWLSPVFLQFESNVL